MGGLNGRRDPMGSSALRLVRVSLYLACTLALMPVQALLLLLGGAGVERLPLYYHRWCCRILGFRIRHIGAPSDRRPALFVANHISYTDIMILGALVPGSFIAKAEVAGWPLFGWLARMQRTVFVDRQARNTARQRAAIAERLARDEALILFPEGTSGDGTRLLPFKSALLGATECESGRGPILVQPVSLAYTRLDGIPIGRLYRPLIAWYGTMALLPHLWKMIGLGTVEVVVEFHPPTTLVACASRKALAHYCQARIAGGLAAALSGRPQPVPGPPGAAVPAPSPATG
jgi:1-acyl-sn-glycerol-3-phosphate acyltransferase